MCFGSIEISYVLLHLVYMFMLNKIQFNSKKPGQIPVSFCQMGDGEHLKIFPLKCNYLKVLNQFDFFASIISNKFSKKRNLPSIHCNMLACLCDFCM